MARFQFNRKAEVETPDPDRPDAASGGSASILAARFGVGRGADYSADNDDQAPSPRTGWRRFAVNPLALLRRLRSGAVRPGAGGPDADGPGADGRGGDGEGRGPRLSIRPFPAAVAATVLAGAGGLVWLAVTADDTVARLEPPPPTVATVLLPDGSPRFAEPEPLPEPEPAEIDPVDLPVELSPSRNEALTERGAAGVLPKVGADGIAPWQFYARPFPHEDTRPRIAIVLTDLGLSPGAVDAAVARLPGAVSMAFQAGADGLQPMIDKAREDGHEVLLSVPMEPVNYPENDPGPGTLLARLSDERNIGRLEAALADVSGYVGLTSTSGSRFLTLEESLRPVLQQVQRRGLLFVDARPTNGSQATRLATRLELPRAVADIQVDRVPSPVGIDAQLQELERLAMANGAAVGFAQAYPVTLERLAEWAAGLRERGIVLAPVTAVVNRQADR